MYLVWLIIQKTTMIGLTVIIKFGKRLKTNYIFNQQIKIKYKT